MRRRSWPPSISEGDRGKFSRMARTEAERDQCESAFTGILRRVFEAVPAVVAAVFIDLEGECIDYVASIQPYDAKVAAAHMRVLLNGMRGARSQALLGEVFAFELVASEREVWVRQFSDEYALVVLLNPGFDVSELRDAVATACREFREEIGLAAPPWEGQERLSVRLRASPGWSYAPAGFSLGGARYGITAVLGRWLESTRPGEPPWVCFRVRTQHGEELTLAHDEHTEVWSVRDA
jgi:8-oxo-dGTP pyrophosphatase MutT (NUDIX family)